MNKKDIISLLNGVKAGDISVDDAVLSLKQAPFEDLGYAKIDTHRELRQGTAEVIFAQNKAPEHLRGILSKMSEDRSHHILLTRLEPSGASELVKEFGLEYDALSRTGILRGEKEISLSGSVVVATGGTSDLPVAEEAAITAEVLGSRVVRVYDVGVAGLHRTLAHLDDFMSANAVIAVAGMEGALASVIGGLCDCPVIGVPTSVGYGASFNGLSALLSMLNSCASGVSVVNIDNGFGAGYLANMINRQTEDKT